MERRRNTGEMMLWFQPRTPQQVEGKARELLEFVGKARKRKERELAWWWADGIPDSPGLEPTYPTVFRRPQDTHFSPLESLIPFPPGNAQERGTCPPASTSRCLALACMPPCKLQCNYYPASSIVAQIKSP
jgi:hypothetical protein